jgi:hypothetical protein
MQTKFLAIGKGSCVVAADTPRDAARAFFERYPMRRLCSVQEGYYRGSTWNSEYRVHRVWRDVSRTHIDTLLPDLASVAA